MVATSAGTSKFRLPRRHAELPASENDRLRAGFPNSWMIFRPARLLRRSPRLNRGENPCEQGDDDGPEHGEGLLRGLEYASRVKPRRRAYRRPVAFGVYVLSLSANRRDPVHSTVKRVSARGPAPSRRSAGGNRGRSRRASGRRRPEPRETRPGSAAYGGRVRESSSR